MPSYELTCEVCDGPFTARRRDARKCSDLCRERSRSPRTPPTSEQRRAWREGRLNREGYRESENAAANERVRAVKQWLAEYKVAHGCVDCGYNAHPVALDIDHVDGKTHHIHKLRSIAAVQAEIARHGCVVRCANCHRIKSWETRTWERHSETAS